jgi:protein-S-isoprenylcysteine O-methyltransferase Ste14
VLGKTLLWLRSLLWTLLLPGVVAGYVPWRFFGLGTVALDPARPAHWAGLLGMALGVTLLAACIVEFARSGKGTLAPPDAPRTLVVQGLYRYVRNPMYLSVTLILLGEALLAWSAPLLVYWALWFVGVNVFVLWYEEPTLSRRFGEDYRRYCARIHRWLPRAPRD